MCIRDRAKASGDEAEFERLRAEVATAKETIEQMGEQETALGTELDNILLGLPNLPFAGGPRAMMKRAMSSRAMAGATPKSSTSPPKTMPISAKRWSMPKANP